MAHLFSITFALFLIINPLGNVTEFLSLMKEIPKERHRSIIIRETFFALLTMLLFNFIGEFLLKALDLSLPTIYMSSGLILFLVGLKIIFPSQNSDRSTGLPKGEPFIVPLAIPMMAGPATLATIMLHAHIEPLISTMIIAIFISWFLSIVIFLASSSIKTRLGEDGLMGVERLIGLLLVLLSIQSFLEGVQLIASKM